VLKAFQGLRWIDLFVVGQVSTWQEKQKMKLFKLIVTISLISTFVLTNLKFSPVLASATQPIAGEFIDIGAALTGANYASVAWGDYDRDGDLDALMSGLSDSGLVTKVYRNDNGIFTDINAGLVGAWQGSVDWGDYDNDNDLDILLTGQGISSIDRITKIYRNDNGFFSDVNTDLPGFSRGTGRWADYDLDGDLDVAFSGLSPSFNAAIFRNDKGVYTNIGAQLTGVVDSSVAWGDYDKDGDLDLAISGSSINIYRNDAELFTNVFTEAVQNHRGSVDWGDCNGDGNLDLLFNSIDFYTPPQLIVYKYGNGNFSSQIALTGTMDGNATWGDFDNDGDLDILITGDPSKMDVYKNNGNCSFTELSADLPLIQYGAAVWGDYDNDGKLDILASGETTNGRVTRIYKNNSANANTIPLKPTGLTATALAFTATLSWNPTTDLQTPQNGLTYNLRIGTTPGGYDVLAPMSDPVTGYRYIPRSGNVGHSTSVVIHGLNPGTKYYWSVQAVDTAFSGSNFAQEGSFETPNIYFTHLPLIVELYTFFLQPGNYPVNRCATSSLYIQGSYKGELTECVPSVEIRSNGFMQFNFTWTAKLVENSLIIKYDDTYNSNMYITDNLLNRYDHIEVGGAAAQTVDMSDGIPVEGWFLFPPAKQGGTSFVFHDDDQGAAIDGIVLMP
jgi:hypothetical protein